MKEMNKSVLKRRMLAIINCDGQVHHQLLACHIGVMQLYGSPIALQKVFPQATLKGHVNVGDTLIDVYSLCT